MSSTPLPLVVQSLLSRLPHQDRDKYRGFEALRMQLEALYLPVLRSQLWNVHRGPDFP